MTRRSYQQNCALALASDVLLERWTVLIFRELLIQPCSYGFLHQVLKGMGTNLLATRLKDMEDGKLIEKENPALKRSKYMLANKGLTVKPIIHALIRWGHFNTTGHAQMQHWHHWDLLAMQALFSSTACKQDLCVQFESQELTAWIHASPQGLDFAVGVNENADITLSLNPQQLNMQIADSQFSGDPRIIDLFQCFNLAKMKQ